MALNIKNAEVELLAAELAQIGQTSKTEAIRIALLERRERALRGMPGGSREDKLRQFLEAKVWPHIPEGAPWTKEEEDAALGYGPEGLPS